MGLNNRLERLEERVAGMKPAPGWTPEKMIERLLDDLDFALATHSPEYLSHDELALLGVDHPRDLPERVRNLVWLRPPGSGMVAKRYEKPPQEPFESWRDRVRKHRERVRAFVEESVRRDAELMAENRKACGLPPLEEAFVSIADRMRGQEASEHPLTVAARNSSEPKWSESFFAGPAVLGPGEDLSES